MNRRIGCLKKAMNTVAAACMPPVFENISIVIPRKKDNAKRRVYELKD
jgi:hypothetical protein